MTLAVREVRLGNQSGELNALHLRHVVKDVYGSTVAEQDPFGVHSHFVHASPCQMCGSRERPAPILHLASLLVSSRGRRPTFEAHHNNVAAKTPARARPADDAREAGSLASGTDTLVHRLLGAGLVVERRQWGLKSKAGNGDTEATTVGTHERIVPLHEPERRAEHAEALVLVSLARHEQRLLSDDALSVDLLILTRGVVDKPVAEQQLSRLRAEVLHPDMIGEYKLALRGIGLGQREARAHGDADAIGETFVFVRH